MYLITTLLLAAWLTEFEQKSGIAELEQMKQEIFAWEPEEEIEEPRGGDNGEFR
ncbi:MAG: hypothetical protein K9M99_00360 [Candidatus Cloacimonetes bacterium]|nr:hypothetical protein [Candidatus Cloacimonadota bacterium]